jgi:hypothetical protein
VVETEKVRTLKINILLIGCPIICLFLSGCGNERLVVKTPISVSASTTSEIVPSPTVVNIETNEVFIPTITSTPRCDSNPRLLLANAILTPDDMITKYPIFKSDNRWTESNDVTSELTSDKSCVLDCAKQLWSPTTVSITLIQSSSPQEASEFVDETRKTFTNILEVTDRPYLSDLARNAWVAYDYSHDEFVLLYSYDSIFVHIVNRPAFGFDDFAGEFDLIYALGRTQNEKLCSSGHEP